MGEKRRYALFCGHLGWGGSGERESVGGRGEDVLDDAGVNVDQDYYYSTIATNKVD